MNVQLFNQLTLPEQVLLVPLKGRFIAQRQTNKHQVKLYYWHNHFLEIHYRWPANRGKAAYWEPYLVNTFLNNVDCIDELLPYVDQINLSDLILS